MNTKGTKKNEKVDMYMSELPDEYRSALEKLREVIRSEAPEAEEGFSYGVPAFKLEGKPLVCFAAFKNHCGFYPLSPTVLDRFSKELSGYETAKGTIRFHPQKLIPDDLIRKIVQARAAEIKEKK